MLELAESLQEALGPLLVRAISDALNTDTCPREAVKYAMDGEEAAAIVAEFNKFRNP